MNSTVVNQSYATLPRGRGSPPPQEDLYELFRSQCNEGNPLSEVRQH